MITVTTVSPPPEENEATDLRERDEFLRVAKKRFQLAAEAERDVRARALEDLEFFAGDQWYEQIVEQRRQDGRPCLTLNRLPEFASQPINQQRQGRPQIQVNPRSGGATVDTAQVLQGLTRHVEVSSQAEAAYDWAFMYAVICGFGYFRYVTEWADEKSFDLDIRIKRIIDPFAVYYDPSCQDPTYKDAQWAFVVEDLIPDEYKRRFPNSKLASLSEFRSVGDSEREWFHDGSIRIAEYWRVEYERRTLVQLADGNTVWEDQLPEDAVIEVRDGEPLIREVEIPRVHSALINAVEVLKGSNKPPFGKPWPGKRIPIIPVLGEEIIINGKRILSGMVRHSKDAQRQYNYMRTALTEQIGLAPKAPHIAAAGQIENYKAMWEQANTRNFAVLVYDPIDVNGHPLPPPQRNFGDPPIAAIATAIAQADADLKSTTRVHEPMIGAMGPEQSGRAIIARQNQGNLANFGYVDNLNQSIMRLGEDLVDIMPKVYDRPGRVVRIVQPDQTHKLVTLNEEFEDKPGVMKIYDLQTGAYDITISVGPGYESKRQEFVQSVLQLVQSAPQIAQFIMDLVVRHMDWPGANEIADRLKKMLPPQLQEDEQAPGQQEIPPHVQQKIEELLQQQAALTEQLNQATNAMEGRRMEIESRERIAAIQEQTKLLVAELKAQSQEGIEMLRQQVGRIDKRLDLLHRERTVEEDVIPSASQPPMAA